MTLLLTLNKVSCENGAGWVLWVYALALGGMLGAKGSPVAGAAAPLSAVLFAAFSVDWVHGALLVLFAIGGMGLFVALSWALAATTAWFVQRGVRTDAAHAPATRTVSSVVPTGSLRSLWRSNTASH